MRNKVSNVLSLIFPTNTNSNNNNKQHRFSSSQASRNANRRHPYTQRRFKVIAHGGVNEWANHGLLSTSPRNLRAAGPGGRPSRREYDGGTPRCLGAPISRTTLSPDVLSIPLFLASVSIRL